MQPTILGNRSYSGDVDPLENRSFISLTSKDKEASNSSKFIDEEADVLVSPWASALNPSGKWS
jgi:hypothetical protein